MRPRRRIRSGAASWLRLLPSAALLSSQVSSVVASPPPPALPFPPLASSPPQAPFHAAGTIEFDLARLRPRQTASSTGAAATTTSSSSSCPASYYSCASQGSAFANICCPLNQVCSLDSNNQPACCPSGAVCTGTAPASAATATTPHTTTYIPDYYYSSFPYIFPDWATGTSTLANREACNAALNQCHENYARCTANLVGGNEASAVAAASAADATATAAAAVGTTATTTGSDGAATTITTSVTTAAATGGTGGFGVTIVVSGTTTVVGRRAVATEVEKREALAERAAVGDARAVYEAALLARYWTTLDVSSAASICSQLSTQACGGLPTDAAGCSSSYTAAATATATGGADSTGGSSSSGGAPAHGSPLVERAVVMAVAAGGMLAGMVGMMAL